MSTRKKDQQSVDELQAKIAYLQGITEKIIDSTRTIDNHANVMVGLNSAIFALVISMLFQVDHLRILMSIVAIFSALSAISAVLAIRLPHLMSRKKYPMSLFHARRIAQFDSADDYACALYDTLRSDEKVFLEYAREAFNLSKYYYTPKRRMLTRSRYFFLFGVVTSSLLLLLEKMHWFML